MDTLIEDEKLNPEETKKFLTYAFRDGELKTTGTGIDKLMPPVSRFGGGRCAKKTAIIEKLLAFFTNISDWEFPILKPKFDRKSNNHYSHGSSSTLWHCTPVVFPNDSNYY